MRKIVKSGINTRGVKAVPLGISEKLKRLSIAQTTKENSGLKMTGRGLKRPLRKALRILHNYSAKI